jgi:hypothetical protein
VTGNCAQHQRALAEAIKTARELVLLPYTQRTVTERPSGRGRDRGPAPQPVAVEVVDETRTEDPEAASGEVEEVDELVEELVEDAVADNEGAES